ncbi:MAG: hypothetical protein JXK94_07850 [Deltaproteobacteria bacterium]|nr:hypothetical protein [Deltaproteobacteria bacterium]
MAFIGEFQAVLDQLHKNREEPLQQFFLKRSNMSLEDIRSYEDFIRIKPFTKGELSQLQTENPPFAGLIDKGRISKIFQSPGPIYNVKGEAFTYYRFHKALEMAGFGAGDIVLNTFSYHLSPAGEMFDDALLKIGAVTFPLGPTGSDKAAELAAAIGATAFIGTRTFLLKTLEHLQGRHQIKKAYLIAEKLTEADRLMFQQDFAVAAFQGYGTAEVGLIATEDSRQDGMVVDGEAIFLEIVEPGSGTPVPGDATGEAIVTFLNSTTPYLRLATGDLSRIHPERPECIAGIFGRADSSVKVKGVFVHFWQFESLCQRLEIKARLVVESATKGTDRIVLLVAEAADEKKLSAEFKQTFGLTLGQIKVDGTIEKSEITDNRTHLSER